MPRKKSCERHYRYVASCPACRALNEKEAEDESRRLYTDVNPEDVKSEGEDKDQGDRYTPPEIPHINEEPEPEKPDKRFKYERLPNPNLKKRLIIVGVIALIAILVGALYGYPVWHAKISLQQQMYDLKSNHVNFWEIFTLNYWSTNFFFNKIGLIGGILGSLLMSIPPDDSIIRLLAARFGWRNLKKWKVLLFWWTGGFVIFYIIGQAIESGGYFALATQLIANGNIGTGLGKFFNALNALSNPAALNETDIFLYQAITQPIIAYILGILIFRIILRLIYLFVADRNELKLAANVSSLIGIFFLIALFNRPLRAQNGIDLIRVWGIFIGILVFFGIAIAFYVKSRKSPGYHFDFLETTFRKRAIVISAGVLFILLLPLFISIPTSINLGKSDVWQNVQWDVRYAQQGDWTRNAAGISYGGTNFFQTLDISNYTEEVKSSDSTILNVIRQYDKENSYKTMSQVSINNYETLADSDIIFVPGKGEFWVAPKTLQTAVVTESAENEHTEIFDHVEGFIALDTSTGETVPSNQFNDIFGVNSSYPIFFGEREDKTFSSSNSDLLTFSDFKSYDNDILLYTNWSRTDTVQYTYEGKPDGTLSGLEAFWYVMNMGLTPFALDSSFKKEFLINRNIRTRVQSVLMPGMKIDDDPYLVFNRENHTLYYAVSLYTEIPMQSYFYSPIYRFLGTVLVNVLNGELTWYKNPAASDIIHNDPLKDIWGIYWDDDYYPWQEVPADGWLISQLRYPETLWEKQMTVDYIYHVRDSRVWKTGTDFFTRPENADVFYIETDLGNGLEFVGVDLVIYNQQDAKKLTGLYVIRQGDHFGETLFYRAQDSDNLIGPDTAQDQLRTQASTEIPATIDPRYGNTLLYPLAGSLYYYIPIYSQATDSTSSSGLETFIKAGLVNAFTKATYYGNTLQEAYTKLALDMVLNDTTIDENVTSDLSLQVNADSEISYSPDNWAEFEAFARYTNTNDSLPQRNITLNMTLRADVNMSVKVFNQELIGSEFNLTEDILAKNYTIATWAGVDGLYPGEGHSLVVKMNPSQPITGGIIVYYSFELIDLDTGEFLTTGWRTFTFSNPNL